MGSCSANNELFLHFYNNRFLQEMGRPKNSQDSLNKPPTHALRLDVRQERKIR